MDSNVLNEIIALAKEVGRNDYLRDQVEHLNYRIDDLTSKYKRASDLIKEKNKLITHLEEENKKFKLACDLANVNKNGLSEKVKELEESKRSEVSKLFKLEKENEKLNKVIENYEVSSKSYSDKIKKLQDEIDLRKDIDKHKPYFGNNDKIFSLSSYKKINLGTYNVLFSTFDDKILIPREVSASVFRKISKTKNYSLNEVLEIVNGN